MAAKVNSSIFQGWIICLILIRAGYSSCVVENAESVSILQQFPAQDIRKNAPAYILRQAEAGSMMERAEKEAEKQQRLARVIIN